MKVNINSFTIEITSMAVQLILAAAIAGLFSHYHVNLYCYQWAVLAVVVCFLLKNNKTTHPITATERYRCWLNIIGFQLLLIATYYGISHYFGAHTFTQLIQYNTAHLGFAPWGAMCLVATVLRLLQQKTGQDTSLVDALMPPFNIKHGGKIWILLNLSIRLATNVVIGITLALLSLNVIYALTGPFTPFSALSIVISLIIILLAVLKKCQPLYKKIVSRRQHLYFMLPLAAIILAFCIAILCKLLSGLSDTVTKTPGIITLLNNTYAPSITPLLFGQSWWLAWSVAGGIFIAKKSQALSNREMLLISALVPIIFYLITLQPSIHSALSTHNWSVIIGFFAFVGLLKLIFQRDMLPCTIINYLPIKQQPKQRSHQFYMVKVIKALLMVLFFAIPIGAQIPAFFSSVIVLPFLLVSICLLFVGVTLLFNRRH